jgi:hypothetical protein
MYQLLYVLEVVVLEVFVIAVVCVDGAVTGNFSLSATSHFVFTLVFIQVPNCYWQGTFRMDGRTDTAVLLCGTAVSVT